MIIKSAQINLASQRQYVKEEHESERFEFRAGPNSQQGRGLGRPLFAGPPAMIDIAPPPPRPQPRAGQNQAEEAKGPLDAVDVDPKADLIKQILEKVLGEKVKITSASEYMEEIEDASAGVSVQNGQQRAGFSMEYEYYRRSYESEQTAFAAEGVVKTADGREINFALELAMSRERLEEEYISVRAGDQQQELVDPLVLNFDGGAAELTDTKFAFDLDSDGEDESVSFLRGGSAFLAFDRNGNGTIDDGSELFGPTTGDGFAELAQYDEDSNGFIDEADSVYNKLSLYNKDGSGQDQLTSLKDGNVGAIYLGNVDTEFSLKDQEGNLDGQVRSSSIFLEEDGGVGSVQQVDLSA